MRLKELNIKDADGERQREINLKRARKIGGGRCGGRDSGQQTTWKGRRKEWKEKGSEEGGKCFNQ